MKSKYIAGIQLRSPLIYICHFNTKTPLAKIPIVTHFLQLQPHNRLRKFVTYQSVFQTLHDDNKVEARALSYLWRNKICEKTNSPFILLYHLFLCGSTQEHPLQAVQTTWLPGQCCQNLSTKRGRQNAIKCTDVMDLTDMHVKSLKVFLPSPFQGPVSLHLNHKEHAMYCISFLHWPSGTYSCSCRK